MKLLSKKLLICIGAFCLIITSVCFAGSYNMVSNRINEDGETEVTYDDGSVSTFDAGDPYIISSKDEGEFTTRTYNDGSVSKIYTYQLDAWKQIFKEHKNLYAGYQTKDINGKKYITRIKYLETKEWIDLPENEYIEKGENDLTMYLCQIYLANKFFPNQDIYTKSMEYHQKDAEQREMLKAKNEASHEKAEEKRQEQQAKQEARINKGDIASIKKDAINYSEICAKKIAGDNHILNDINDIQSYIASYAPYVETAYKNGNKWYRSDVQYSSDVTVAKNLTDEDLKNIITKHNGKSTPNDKDTKKLSIAGFIVFDKWIMTPSEYEEYLNKTYDYMIGAIDSINLDEKASVSNKKSAIKSIKTEFAKKKPNGNTSEIDDVKKAIDLRDSLKNKMDEYAKAIIN